MDKIRFTEYGFPLLLILSFTLVYTLIFDSKLDINGDNASYYILGKSIAMGDGYTAIHLAPARSANHYPPGYPALIAMVMKLINSEINTIKVFNGILFLLSILLLFKIAQVIGFDVGIAFLLCIYIMLNKHLLLSSTIMMSEIPFLCFSLAVIYLFLKTDLTKSPFKGLNFIAVIVLTVACLYIRTIGIALICGIALYLIINKSFKHLATFSIAIIAGYFPWYLRGESLGGNSYLKSLAYKNIYRPELGFMQPGDWVTRFLSNLKRYLGAEIPGGILPMSTYKLPNDVTSLNIIIGIIIISLALVGLLNLRHGKLLLWYLLGFFSILLLWPEVWTGTRFMQPTIPIITIGLFASIIFITNKITRKEITFKPVLLIPAVFVMALMMAPEIKQLKNKAESRHNQAFLNYFAIADWVSKNTSKQSIIACRKPELFYLYAKRRATIYKYTSDDIELIEDMKRRKVDYVIVDNLGFSTTGRYLVPAINKNPDKFQILIHLKNPDTYLLRVKNISEASPGN